ARLYASALSDTVESRARARAPSHRFTLAAEQEQAPARSPSARRSEPAITPYVRARRLHDGPLVIRFRRFADAKPRRRRCGVRRKASVGTGHHRTAPRGAWLDDGSIALDSRKTSK